ncbi:PTS sugar transporter subunit IIA [Rahnella perminowiae]|uniref:PTS sugar transporter subunit IIA n=1 Tax=Rahnella perminowiae TaxID=2816244 RepID=A0ABS6L2Y9_9GAMM|nr:PTS sugar transporter subunit IIA [Rahnella perminowiae]MBU9835924.1 PTS sugar transporter subunit IIA [Rahnella perminowiae]MCR8999278.1 PTS sugar transporter subunit IIA [Rahnella perminowiae]
MLNPRQKDILSALSHQRISGQALARRARISVRTLLRDIDYINYRLGAAGKIISGAEGYQLLVEEGRDIERLLGNAEDALFLALIFNACLPLGALADKLRLSKSAVIDLISTVRKKSRTQPLIGSRPKHGHSLLLDDRQKVLLLANLIIRNPACCGEHCAHAFSVRIVSARSLLTTLDYPFGTPLFLAALGLAVEYLPATHLSVVKILQPLRHKLSGITPEAIRTVLTRVATPLPGLIDEELVGQLTAHIQRSVACPAILPVTALHDFRKIKTTYPQAFDLSLSFVRELNQSLAIDFNDDDWAGLYFACALERTQSAALNLVIYSEYLSMATLNKEIIEREISGVNVIIATHPEQLIASLLHQPVALVLNNHRQYPAMENATAVWSVSELVGQRELEQLRIRLAGLMLYQHSAVCFPESLSFTYANAPQDNWQTVISGICQHLVLCDALTVAEAELIVAREAQGENLIINHLAVPHCSGQRDQPFIGIFVHLENPLLIESQRVQNVLVVCVNARGRQELKMFSHLADALNGCESAQLLGLTTHASFMQCLNKPFSA